MVNSAHEAMHRIFQEDPGLSVGAVSADTVEKYISTQWERPQAKKHKEERA